MKKEPSARPVDRLPSPWERIAGFLLVIRPYAEDVFIVLLG